MINVCSPFFFLILPTECSASTQTAWKLMPTHPCRSIIRIFLLAQAATEQLRLAQSQSLIKTTLKVTSTFRCSIWIQFWIFFETKESIKNFTIYGKLQSFPPLLLKKIWEMEISSYIGQHSATLQANIWIFDCGNVWKMNTLMMTCLFPLKKFVIKDPHFAKYQTGRIKSSIFIQR